MVIKLIHQLKADYEGFERSPHNKGALVNTDNSALTTYKSMKQRFSKLNKMDELETRISSMEGTLAEMLTLVKSLVSTKDNP
jgi:CRISPR/Cas system-associated endonuclease Cas1